MTVLKRGMILDVNLDPVQGAEKGKIRPCVIVTNDVYNERVPVIQVVPITEWNEKKARMAFARPEGMSQSEFRRRVEGVCAWFESLNPYDKPGSILEFEDENNDADSGQPRDLFCYAISAKRYALFNCPDSGVELAEQGS